MPVKRKNRLAAGEGRKLGRHAATAIALTLMTTACAPIEKPEFWANLPGANAQSRADEGIAALARGEFIEAEAKINAALKADPRNPYALLAAGTLYQNSGRLARARQAFEEVLSLPDVVPVNGSLWGVPEATTAQQVAEAGLAGLGAVPVESAGASGVGGADGMEAAMPLGVMAVIGEERGRRLAGKGVPPDLGGALWPEAQRFRVLKDLRDDGLITPEEYARRRAANLGALLPLSQEAPAVGLERPVADSAAIADRLRQLRIAYEDRYISAAQHAAEREVILDSLLPANPRDRAPEARLPNGVVEIAAAVGRLERLLEEGLISQAEMRAERQRLERALAGKAPAAKPRTPEQGQGPVAKPAPKPAQSPAAQGQVKMEATRELGSDAKALSETVSAPTLLVPDGGASNPAAVLRSGRQPLDVVPYKASGETTGKEGAEDAPKAAEPEAAPAAVPATGPVAAAHLASFRTEERAQAGWRELSGKYAALKGTSPRIVRVDLPGKGVFYRLHAAPLASMDAAKALCTGLQGQQYCDPTSLE